MKIHPNDPLPIDWENHARVFTALGDAQRQRILLMFSPDESLNISEIVAAMPLSRSAVVHHLQVLAQAEVLTAERSGKEVRYRVNSPAIREALNRVIGFLDLHHYP
ncbi:MAG: metalloregulator ArsR/SmtB family transcription factor [Halothiobacillaceae bacterium]|nr:metalloregulator ArsR/SmtB family transcription factor [Halothiobacillaceae bacterium]